LSDLGNVLDESGIPCILKCNVTGGRGKVEARIPPNDAGDVDEGRGARSRREVESTFVSFLRRRRSCHWHCACSISVPLRVALSVSILLPPPISLSLSLFLSLAFLFPTRRVDRNRRASFEEAPRGSTVGTDVVSPSRRRRRWRRKAEARPRGGLADWSADSFV